MLADGGRIIFNLVRSWQISRGREMARVGDRNRFVGIFASKDLAAVAPSDGPSASLCVAIFKPFLYHIKMHAPHLCLLEFFVSFYKRYNTSISAFTHFEHTVGICLIHHQFIISCSPKSRVKRCLTASSLSTEALLSNPVQRGHVFDIYFDF